MKDILKEQERLLTIWGDRKGKSRTTEINTPALADCYKMHKASSTMLAQALMEDIVHLQLIKIAKEEHISEKDALLIFTQKLADRLGITDTTAIITESPSPAQGTPIATVCMDNAGHLNVGVNSNIENFMLGKEASGSDIEISRLGIEALIIAACRLVAEQVETGEDIPEAIEYMMECFSKGMQSEIPFIKIEAGIANHQFASPMHGSDDDDGKNTLPS